MCNAERKGSQECAPISAVSQHNIIAFKGNVYKIVPVPVLQYLEGKGIGGRKLTAFVNTLKQGASMVLSKVLLELLKSPERVFLNETQNNKSKIFSINKMKIIAFVYFSTQPYSRLLPCVSHRLYHCIFTTLASLTNSHIFHTNRPLGE